MAAESNYDYLFKVVLIGACLGLGLGLSLGSDGDGDGRGKSDTRSRTSAPQCCGVGNGMGQTRR